MNRRRLTKAAVVCAAVALPMVISTGQAAAAGLTVSNVACESLGLHAGKTSMICYADVSGGNGSYTYQWTGSNAVFTKQNAIGRGYCSTNNNYSVSVTVRDTAGHTGTNGGTFYCNAIPR